MNKIKNSKETIAKRIDRENFIREFIKNLRNELSNEKDQKKRDSLKSKADYLSTVLKLTSGQIDKGWISDEQALVTYLDVISKHIEKA